MHKYLQRRLYDVFTSKSGVLTAFFSLILLISSVFYFGEAIVEWSTEKYAVVFNSFSDNLLGKSFRTRLCLPVPIDAVYTWVNGTDPDLLMALREAKADLEGVPNNRRKCEYANCVKAPVAVFPNPLPSHVTKEYLSDKLAAFKSVYKLSTVSSDDLRRNVTMAYFFSRADAMEAINKTIDIDGVSYTALQGFYTSDVTIPNSKLQKDIVLVSGFKSAYSVDDINKLLPKYAQEKVYDIEMIGNIGVFRTTTSSDAEALVGLAYNFTVDKRYLQLNKANLVYDLTYSGHELDLSASRFEDNEELRYSLRSLEQYAPWIRQVFIVTNGQIPYWLNLEHPRVKIITHEQVFSNKSHLPTFSSPSIESHLHRIPGLSDKFLYFNDDVMFGSQVWPDDFYTHSRGQKVYLSWNIPDCAPGCPQSWLKDGYCDKACNVSQCDFDAGDCSGGVPAFNMASRWNQHQSWDYYNQPESELTMCSPGCSNSWIADKYCDQSCNNKECGFDAGDCGVKNYHLLHGEIMQPNKNVYQLPDGISEAYLNFSLLSTDKVSAAVHDDSPTVRIAAVSNKYKVVTLVLLKNHTKDTFRMNITFGEQETKNIFQMTVITHTRGKTALTLFKPDSVPNSPSNDTHKTPSNATSEPPFIFPEVSDNMRGPHIVELIPPNNVNPSQLQSLNVSQLPADVQLSLHVIEQALENGEITQQGYNKRRVAILSSAVNSSAVLKSDDVVRSGRQIKSLVQPFQEEGFLPWEKTAEFKAAIQKRDDRLNADSFQIETRKSRHLMDTFAQSLHHVNGLYNKRFGVKARKVPGHIPHMIDREVMEDLQETFKDQWDITSSHKIRSGNDMQYAFSYFYFLMDSKRNNTEFDFLEDMDIDGSRVLSDRELRTLATRIFESPLDLQSLMSLENHIINCSRHLPADKQDLDPPPLQQETYYQINMPQVTLTLLANCDPILELIRKKVPPRPKYRFEQMGDDDIHFKMIGTNLSTVVGQLDNLRRHPRKFICLNDNIDHTNSEAIQVKALLADFYESLFPIRSQFELPADYRNRFLHVDELNEWKRYRDYMKYTILTLLVLLIIYTLYSFYEDQPNINTAPERMSEFVVTGLRSVLRIDFALMMSTISSITPLL